MFATGNDAPDPPNAKHLLAVGKADDRLPIETIRLYRGLRRPDLEGLTGRPPYRNGRIGAVSRYGPVNGCGSSFDGVALFLGPLGKLATALDKHRSPAVGRDAA